CSRAMTVSISDFGRGRLPVWVVRMRSVEVFMQGSGMGQALILAFSTRDCRAWARAAVAVAALATLSRVGYSLPMGRPIIRLLAVALTTVLVASAVLSVSCAALHALPGGAYAASADHAASA